jgi:hypothetical protein
VTVEVIVGEVYGSENTGVYNTTNANPTMTDVTITASAGDSDEAYGVYNEVSSSATIRDSSLSGTTNSLLPFGGTSKIANTQLIGAVGKADGATLQCVNNYDENMQPVTCP